MVEVAVVLVGWRIINLDKGLSSLLELVGVLGSVTSCSLPFDIF